MSKESVIKQALSFKHGGMSERELSALYDFCQNKDVIELGSMAGMSSYVIASVCKSLNCVDAWDDTYEHLKHSFAQIGIYTQYFGTMNMFQLFVQNCREFIDTGKIIIHKGTTELVCKDFEDESVDIVIIDADHSYFGICNDYKNYNSKIRNGGLFIFHDYGDSMWTDIKKFCDEMIVSKELEVIHHAERIIVLRKVN
jgi:predicted O-methyltransferase YrrM